MTLIGTQMSHIDFINVEQNAYFVNAYCDLLVGDWIPMILLILIKLTSVFIFAFLLVSIDKNIFIAILFGIVFSVYSIANIGWIILIFEAPLPSQLMFAYSFILLFLVSFLIYYSPSELKRFFSEIKYKRNVL